jgi:class 3 adenylate cyclase
LRMDYTAVGETTNLANRMETMARPGGILISENTQRLVNSKFILRPESGMDGKFKKSAHIL